MIEKLKYTGAVDESGALKLPGAKIRADVARLFRGKEVEITIQRRRKHRSAPQNRFYWGVVVPMVQAGIKDLGDELTTEQVHELLKIRHLKETKIDKDTGELLYEFVRSTAALSTGEFMEYIERCAQFAAEYLGVVIPQPER